MTKNRSRRSIMTAAPTSSSYFSKYANTLTPNPNAPLSAEFDRLATQMGWSDGRRRHERILCFQQEFSALNYGRDGTKLEGWQRLCADVGVPVGDIPVSITQCKKILKTKWINLVDLIDARRSGKRVRLFKSKYQLRNYTIREERFFPKEVAKEDGFLRALLIDIFA